MALILLLAGCRSIPPLPPVNLSEAGWTTRQGQAVWHPAKADHEVTGELLVATHIDGRALVEFTKPPVTIVSAQSTTNSWTIRGGPQNRTYSRRGNPPSGIIWLQLPRYLAGGMPSKSWSWTKPGASSWRLEHKATGEFLEGYFNP